MSIRIFAYGAGILYIGAGILGFIPGFTSSPPMDAPSLTIEGSYSYLFGLFPVNILHNFVHIGIGVWGLLSSGSGAMARIFAISVAVIYALLAVLGIIPEAHTLFGFVPLFGHDVWLHAATAVVAGYFGFFTPPGVVTVRRTNRGTDNVKVYEEQPRL